MKKKNIAILFGGASAEYLISLQSAYAVITHLDTDKYVPVLVGVTKQGHWFHYRGDAEDILSDTWCDPKYCVQAFISPYRKNTGLVEFDTDGPNFTKLDAAFPIMHGSFGEDGTVQGLLELAGIPIVGCGTLASAICMDKDVAHKLAAREGIAVPPSMTFARKADLGEIKATAEALGYPVFVKPVKAGSSFGISKVVDFSSLPVAVEEALKYDTRIILEKEIEGFEVGCAVLGNDELTVGELDEVELKRGFFDYREKYNLITAKIHVPARISAEKASEVKQIASKLYRLFRCSGFARIDFFVDLNGKILFNEVNTIPGFTTHSRYPAMMKSAGLDFGTVVNKLIEMAVAP